MILTLGNNEPVLSPDAWVADSATVVGAVQVGAHSSIWFGAVVRADEAPITIGEESNIQDNCVLHADPGAPLTIGDRVGVGHGAILHGCYVESDVLVGMGATVLNHVHIGSGSLIAAGAVLLEGTIVPAGSLVAGVPGKVRRSLTPEEHVWVRKNTEDYVKLAQQYRESLPGGS